MRWRMVVLAVLAGCGKAPPMGPPVVVDASRIEPMVYWSSDLNGRRVSLDGYIGFDNGGAGEAIAIGEELTTQPLGRGDELIRFDLPRGEGPNQLRLHELGRETFAAAPASGEVTTFDPALTTFQDSAGKAHALDEKVRVTGTLVYPRLGDVGLLSDEDRRSPNGRRFKPRLEDVVLEAAP